jgi:hypothetical protein
VSDCGPGHIFTLFNLLYLVHKVLSLFSLWRYFPCYAEIDFSIFSGLAKCLL